MGGFGCVRTGANLQAGALGCRALAGVWTERLLNGEVGSEVEMLEEEGARGHGVLLASARGTAPRAGIAGGCRRDLGGLRDPFVPFFVMSSAFLSPVGEGSSSVRVAPRGYFRIQSLAWWMRVSRGVWSLPSSRGST